MADFNPCNDLVNGGANGLFVIRELGLDLPNDADLRQRVLGQFHTSEHVATFMASMLNAPKRHVRLLDAGAGNGILTLAAVQQLTSRQNKPVSISVTLYEIDATAIPAIEVSLLACKQLCDQQGIGFEASVFNADFIQSVIPLLRNDLYGAGFDAPYNIAIVNPPYRQIRSDSQERLLLRSIGIEAGNLYAAFVALIARLLQRNGELVAITPRSFANGPYFQSFRKDLLTKMSLRHLHLFDSRAAAFRAQSVLQENVIFHAVKDTSAPKVITLSSSSGAPNAQVTSKRVKYSEVVQPDDADSFIHFEVKDAHVRAEQALRTLSNKLPDLGLTVSTGRVVEFRSKQYLAHNPMSNTLPLIFPYHFNGGFIEWPKSSKRLNSIFFLPETADLLVPTGTYVLVKRFSTKEERRRIVACVFDPSRIDGKRIGFENHLNYFHFNGHGLERDLAIGLAAYLNSSVVDTYFRRFSGHTQVNATDLRKLSYPSTIELERIGRAIHNPGLPQQELDQIVNHELWIDQEEAQRTLRRLGS